jgi:CHAT domain-containing protein
LPGQEELRALVEQYSKARNAPDTGDADRNYWSAAEALSNAVIGPVAGKLKSARLVVVADDVLQQVSFAGLPWPPGDGKPAKAPGPNPPARRAAAVPLLIRFQEIVYLPSVSVLAGMREFRTKGIPPKQVAIVANPLYGPDRDRLAASGREAAKLSALVPRQKSLVLTGADASLENLGRARLGDFRDILFAAHAVVDFKHPDLSGIILSELDASGRRRDGVLRLLDIYSLKLRAKLVMLSACQSGDGRDIAGEGLVALSRGFIFAGARSVIATLWPIDEARAALLEGGVFTRLLGQPAMSAAAVLQEAQLSRWKLGESPRRWAAFVISGDFQKD